jgi:hypothetical protein
LIGGPWSLKKAQEFPGPFYFMASSLYLTLLKIEDSSMKMRAVLGMLLLVILSSSSYKYQGENVEFICYKTHKATNTCHYNFIINGAKYRHVDIGCKFANKKEEMIKKVKEGSAALARDWKIACPEAKEKKEGEF